MRQHTNAFDLIRLAAAGMVLWWHQHALMGISDEGASAYGISLGRLGVFIFFVVSGYLNTLSAIRRHSWRSFLLSRGLRIYPALIVCVAFTVLLGACVAPDLGSYFDQELLAFIGKNITLFTGVKAGLSNAVFVGNAIPDALNGSLWTLPYEVKMYVLLAAGFVIFRYNVLVALSVATSIIFVVGFSELGTIWLQFATLFVVGAFMALVQSRTNLGAASFAVLVLSLFFALMGRELIVTYLLLSVGVIVLGRVRLPYWLRPPVDISYAVYLYAFPVQQLSARLTENFWIGLAFSISVTFLLALCSALFVERPVQKYSKGSRLGAGSRAAEAADGLASDAAISKLTSA